MNGTASPSVFYWKHCQEIVTDQTVIDAMTTQDRTSNQEQMDIFQLNNGEGCYQISFDGVTGEICHCKGPSFCNEHNLATQKAALGLYYL